MPSASSLRCPRRSLERRTRRSPTRSASTLARPRRHVAALGGRGEIADDDPVPARTRDEKLFGLACVRVTLECRGLRPEDNEIYRGALEDLGCEDADVTAYLAEHRSAVEAKVGAPSRLTR